jgi:hypothetical protein
LPLNRTYPGEIIRNFQAGTLTLLSETEADRGEEDGLAGNQHYQDLRGVSWDEVARTVEREAELIRRFEDAEDLNREAELFDEERDLLDDDLWGLDIGVAGATVALSALGAVPVSSCNAGGFGGRHVARFPYVAFYLPQHLADSVLSIATAADVGLDIVEDGIGRVFGRTDYDLHRFAALALERHGETE